MAEIFRSKKWTAVVIGILCIAVLGAVFLINALRSKPAAAVIDDGDQAAVSQIGPKTIELAKPAEAVSSLFKLAVNPGRYTPTMSSTPGIRLTALHDGTVDRVKYTASFGTLLTWDTSTGKITQFGQSAELPADTPVYWTPLTDGARKTSDEIVVTADFMSKDAKLAEKQVKITPDGSNAPFTVEASEDVVVTENVKLPPQNPETIDDAVGSAIKARGKSYQTGEVATEGHVLLATEEKDGVAKAYTVSSFGWFGFENGIFTKISGSGAIPTVITFSKDESGGYVLQGYKEPMDGSLYSKSIKKMFPKKLWNKVLSGDGYPELAKQQEEQAKLYLLYIGRDAKVSEAHVEKTLAKIDTGASNKLFSEFTKYDAELNNFPYWLGSREFVIDGVRYIYETIQGKTDDGYDLITFKKSKADGTVVKEIKYKIVGNDPQLIN